MDDPFSPERKTVRLNKQNLFGSGYAGLGTNRHLTRRLLSVPADIQSGGKVAGERPLRVSDALSVRTIDGDGRQSRSIEKDGGQAMPLHQRGHPVGETRLEGQRIQQAEDAAERIVGRDTLRACERILV